MRRLWVSLVLTAWLASVALSASAAEPTWTRFRGPNGTGIGEAAAFPDIWSEKDYAWRVALPGIGFSSPVVWDDRLYVTSTLEEEARLFIHCRKTTDGSVVWEREVKTKPHPPFKANCDASTTPAVDRDRVYVVWGTPDEHVALALDQQSGKEIWRRDLGPYVAEDGFGASPILVGDVVVLTNDQDPEGTSSIVALDRATGAIRWKIDRESKKAIYSTPCLFEPEGAKPQLIVFSSAHGITSLDPNSGTTNWELGSVFEIRTTGSPLVASDMIFGSNGAGSGGKYLVAVRAGIPERDQRPEVVYQIKKDVPYVPTPVAKWPLVFLWSDVGVVTCIDGPTGTVHWRHRVGGRYLGSPVLVGDKIYCISCTGEMTVLAAADKLNVLGKTPLGEDCNSTPTVVNGVMYLRTVSHVMALRATTESR